MKFSTITFSEILKILIKRRKLTFKKIFNLLKNFLAIVIKKSHINTLPSFIMLDPTKACNLKCPDCVETSSKFVVQSKIFEKEKFFRVIDEIYEDTLIMALYLSGEPFLHKDIFKMINYGHSKRMYMYLSSNFSMKINEQFASNIVNSGLDAMFISVSGNTNESHQRMHVGGDIEVVKNNIKMLQNRKKALNSKYPKVAIRYLMAKYNTDEMNQLSEFARENGCEFFEVSLMAFSNTNDDSNESMHQERIDENKVCFWPWLMLAMHSDGQVQTCCKYPYNLPIIGNVSTQTVSQLWNSKIQNQFREKMSRGKNGLESCKNCEASFGFQRTMYDLPQDV